MILALDIASVCGWAVGGLDGSNEPPTYGSERLGKKGADVDHKALHLYHFLHRKIDDMLRPQYLVFEAPILIGTDIPDLVQLLFGLPQIAALVALQRDLVPYKAPGLSVTKFFTGQGKFPGATRDQRTRAKKQAVMDKCRRDGLDPPDHNCADALAILSYSQSILGRGRVTRAAGPLFAMG